MFGPGRGLYYDEAGQPVGMWAHYEHMQDQAVQRVAFDWIGMRRGNPSWAHVSTVFLGVDMGHSHDQEIPPLIYETMVFGSSWDQLQMHWPSRDLAALGHAAVVAKVRESARRVEDARIRRVRRDLARVRRRAARHGRLDPLQRLLQLR